MSIPSTTNPKRHKPGCPKAGRGDANPTTRHKPGCPKAGRGDANAPARPASSPSRASAPAPARPRLDADLTPAERHRARMRAASDHTSGSTARAEAAVRAERQRGRADAREDGVVLARTASGSWDWLAPDGPTTTARPRTADARVDAEQAGPRAAVARRNMIARNLRASRVRGAS